MSKVKIVGIILGVMGLFIIGWMLIWTLPSIGFDIRDYEVWEIRLISQAAVGLASSLTLGIVGLLVNNERKSPYLLGVSTVLTSLSLVFLGQSMTPKWIASNIYRGGVDFGFMFIPLILLLASTILIAYTNIWKKTEKAIK